MKVPNVTSSKDEEWDHCFDHMTIIQLPNGKYPFSFVFIDFAMKPTASWSDPFGPSSYAGPSVGANAQPVAPGTIVSPSHDDDPDQYNQTD